MESLKELYKIGPGPSSSHTIGPKKACELIMSEYPNANNFIVTLQGSLALTGKGHLTDRIIETTFNPLKVIINYDYSIPEYHPNGMLIEAFEDEVSLDKWEIFSIGGGTIEITDKLYYKARHVYLESTFNDIIRYLDDHKVNFIEYVKQYDDPDVFEHLGLVLDTMFACVKRGLSKTGLLPGNLNFTRISKDIYDKAQSIDNPDEKDRMLISSYAYAVSEENASGGLMVTAPTCGSSGVIPALVYHLHFDKGFDRQTLIDGLACAGIIGNVIKTNATVSGAEGGCQAEIGSACSMAAALYSYVHNLENYQIEFAAEVALEHHLGLTCDPVGGYVLIPCIERNGIAALRAIDSSLYAKHIGSIRKNRISFDMAVHTMKVTGQDLKVEYKETALGGLAKEYKE